jgi:hypothetical protein
LSFNVTVSSGSEARPVRNDGPTIAFGQHKRAPWLSDRGIELVAAAQNLETKIGFINPQNHKSPDMDRLAGERRCRKACRRSQMA